MRDYEASGDPHYDHAAYIRHTPKEMSHAFIVRYDAIMGTRRYEDWRLWTKWRIAP